MPKRNYKKDTTNPDSDIYKAVSKEIIELSIEGEEKGIVENVNCKKISEKLKVGYMTVFRIFSHFIKNQCEVCKGEGANEITRICDDCSCRQRYSKEEIRTFF